MSTVRVITLILAMISAASAQWVNLTLPNTPRTPDGKPDLTAPTPRTRDGKPDLTGIWRVASGKYLQNIAADLGELPFQPWAAALYKERVGALGKGRPSERCIAHGIPDGLLVRNFPFKIVQTPGVVVILYEEFNHYRQIFTDGRGFPPETNASWYGFSIGKWEGDTLVAETAGLNDKGWLDDPGHPRSEALRVTERFHRRDFGQMDIQITFDDSKAYTKPWTVTIPFNLYPDTELIESICENEKDQPHMVGK
ncbi:MAG: hypothetical protein HY646_07900 [Acidobacteria bacterium]|nr:hypothetical protein [Acidobacteriota bacterium]